MTHLESRRSPLAAFGALLFTLIAVTGCNSSDPAGELAASQRRISDLEQELAQTRAERDRLQGGAAAYEQRIGDISADLTRARTRNTEMQTELDSLRERASLTESELRGQLDRASQPVVDFGPIENTDIKERQDAFGNTILELSSEVLFTPGSEVIGERGARALDDLRQILNERFPTNKIEIAGHTDTDPIMRARAKFKSNMELSLARAHSVFANLAGKGLTNLNRVHATGYGEYVPVEVGETPEAKRKNRRVEVKVFR